MTNNLIVKPQDKAYNYQVFLSFRGEDTRKTFTGHLYAALIQAGIRTFKDDDEIERGKRLDSELRNAIQQSRISIVVLSKNYSNSKWCLDELVVIMRAEKSGHIVLPIFFDVEPSDVRNLTGTFGATFGIYEEEFVVGGFQIDGIEREKRTERVRAWKTALTQVSNITGMVLQYHFDGHEATFIQEIIKVVEHKLHRRSAINVDAYLVGMHSRVSKIDLWLHCSSSSEDILIIYGMGGIGKTTIAKFVYNSNFQRFEGSCFLGSVKEKARQPNGLVHLQMHLLSNILNGKKKDIYDVDEGIVKINEAIWCKKLLLVIDDVDDYEQLDALLGKREFHPGSKIIITTRNMSLLKTHEGYKLHKVEKLDDHESLELFCWHAFGKDTPREGFKELSRRVVCRCGGLPLANKILGSSLAEKSTKVWTSTLEKLEAFQETKILNVLKISFDSLQDDHDRNLFLHIACFFVGRDKDETIEILDACDFFTVCGIQNLIERCLISIELGNNIVMHQLLQEMGWSIVDQESPKEPGRRSRLWRPEDSFMVLKDNKGTDTIEGLILDMKTHEHDIAISKRRRDIVYEEFSGKLVSSNEGSLQRNFFKFWSSPINVVDFNYLTLTKMQRLRLLKLNYAKMSGSLDNFPTGIRWLCWHGFDLKYIPFDLTLKNLVYLDMSFSKLEHVWIGNKVLLSLKILNLSHSKNLLKTPNFEGLRNLQKLILTGCVKLVEVDDTIGDLKRLVMLNLKNCRSLRKFPNIFTITSLETLVVDGCTNIFHVSTELVEFSRVRINLSRYTFLSYVKAWCASFQQQLSKPSILNNPRYLSVSFPRFLTSLSLQDCNLSNDDFQLDLSQLSMLDQLDLSFNRFHNLPRSVGSLFKLQKLSLISCKELVHISNLPNVSFLDVDHCSSLKSITYHQTNFNRPFASFDACFNLREFQGMFKIEPLHKVDSEIVSNLELRGLDNMGRVKLNYIFRDFYWCDGIDGNTRQGLYEFGIFSTYLAQEEAPLWCIDGSNNGTSSSVSLVIPSDPSLMIRGLNVYSSYTLSHDYSNDHTTMKDDCLLFIKINNKTKDLCWMYSPVLIATPLHKNYEEQQPLVWLSHWKFTKSHLEIGDEIDVSVIAADAFLVKEFGINLVWGEKDRPELTVARDLSFFEIMKGTFFLTLRYEVVLLSPGNWVLKLFEDRAECEDYKEWLHGTGKDSGFYDDLDY